MSIQFLKNDSHRMIDRMWGITSKGQRRAYNWLNSNLGYTIHFATSSNKDIQEAHKLLYNRMIRKGFDYLEKPLQTLAKSEPKIDKPKEKKVNQIAPNALKLQRTWKSPVPIRKISFWQKIKKWISQL